MSKTFTHADPARPGHLIQVTYYDTTEAADLLGVSVKRLRAQCAADRWPHLREELGDQHRYWMNADDIGRVNARRRHDPDAMVIHYDDLTEAEPRRHLIALSDDDVEGVQ